MNENSQQEAMLIRNLHDSGCPQELVEQFMTQNNTNNTAAQIQLLTAHRRTILNRVHEEQAKLDCIDYLVFQLKKNSSATRRRSLSTP